jgi:hypothetical protein
MEELKMNFNFEVKRIRYSTTQGEALVLCNGQEIVQYGDDIQIVDKEWKSTLSDETLIQAALKNYSDKIMNSTERV